MLELSFWASLQWMASGASDSERQEKPGAHGQMASLLVWETQEGHAKKTEAKICRQSFIEPPPNPYPSQSPLAVSAMMSSAYFRPSKQAPWPFVSVPTLRHPAEFGATDRRSPLLGCQPPAPVAGSSQCTQPVAPAEAGGPRPA